MLNTKQDLLKNRGRWICLPLFLLWWAVSCRSEGSFSSPEKIPAERRDSVRAKLYPFVAGAHAARDSVEAYRWELWIEQGETLYFGLSRPTRSRFPNRREAVVGRVIPSDTGWRHYEELFWTYRFPSDTMRAVVEGLYRLWRKGEDLRNYNEHYVAFPDPYTFYDQSQRRWRRVIAGDTL